MAHGLSCSEACGISPDQGLNLCPLHWQVDSSPLDDWGSAASSFASGGSTIQARAEGEARLGSYIPNG